MLVIYKHVDQIYKYSLELVHHVSFDPDFFRAVTFTEERQLAWFFNRILSLVICCYAVSYASQWTYCLLTFFKNYNAFRDDDDEDEAKPRRRGRKKKHKKSKKQSNCEDFDDSSIAELNSSPSKAGRMDFHRFDYLPKLLIWILCANSSTVISSTFYFKKCIFKACWTYKLIRNHLMIVMEMIILLFDLCLYGRSFRERKTSISQCFWSQHSLPSHHY